MIVNWWRANKQRVFKALKIGFRYLGIALVVAFVIGGADAALGVLWAVVSVIIFIGCCVIFLPFYFAPLVYISLLSVLLVRSWLRAATGHVQRYLSPVSATVMNRTETRYQRDGHPLHYGPVAAAYCGDPTCAKYQSRTPGVLTISDNTLVFEADSSAGFAVQIPLSSLQQLSPDRRTELSQPPSSPQKNKVAYHVVQLIQHYYVLDTDNRDDAPQNVALHCGTPDGPQVHNFTIRDLPALVATLNTLTGREILAPPDRGPIQARQMRQDIYGRWKSDFTGDLYLAPERLVFEGKTAVDYAQIQRIVVVHEVEGRPMLRFDYTGADGRPQVIGWSMGLSHVETWVTDLHERLVVPLERYDPRKKKAEEDAK